MKTIDITQSTPKAKPRWQQSFTGPSCRDASSYRAGMGIVQTDTATAE